MEENRQDEQEQSLEEMFQELDEILAQMENSDLPLDETFALYETGLKKLKKCNEKMDLVEKRMLELSGGGELTEFE